MSSAIHRTPKSSGRQSLFFNDLATPGTARRSESGKFKTPDQSAAVSALRQENFVTSDLPPPPVFTLEDRSDLSPVSCIPDYPIFFAEPNSNPRTPARTGSMLFSTTPNKSSEPNSNRSTSSYVLRGNQQLQIKQSPVWFGNGGDDTGKGPGSGSPVEGIVHHQQGALITLPVPREVARQEIRRNSLPVDNLDEEEWITVYGFSSVDTNLVLREFEKCGVILKHVPGTGGANWIHILYQSRSCAHKALSKNGMQINGALIIGVKPADAMHRQALSSRPNNEGFMPLATPTARNYEPMVLKASENGSNNMSQSQSGGTLASPAKSVISKVMDLMFGV